MSSTILTRLIRTYLVTLAALVCGPAFASAPSITQQPVSLNAGRGTTVVLSVTAIGTTPLNYQWSHDGNLVTAGTSSALAITNVQAADAGTYSVQISNSEGVMTSSNATLVVGRIAVWGAGSLGLTQQMPLDFTDATSISAGASHLLATGPAGRVVGWGALSSTYSILTNVPDSLPPCRAVGASQPFSMALASNGSVSVWGFVGAWTNVPATLTNAVMISAGGNHCLALGDDGTITAWGSQSSPTNVPAGLVNAVCVSASASGSIAALADGMIAGWGGNVPSAAFIASVTNAIAVSSGYDHSLVLRRDGTVAATGGNSYGQINTPAGLSNVVAIAAGGWTSYALTQDGNLYGWGYSSGIPPVLSNVIAVAARSCGSPSGAYSAAALMNDGAPAITIQPINQTVQAPDVATLTVRAAASGNPGCQWFFESAPILGQTNYDLVLPSVRPLDAGSYFAVVSNALGQATSAVAKLTVLPPRNVRVWGSASAVTNLPLGLYGVVSVSSRSNHVLSLNDGGAVALWGNPYSGATGGVAVVQGAKAVSAGLTHSLVLKSNGTVTCWGNFSAASVTNVPPNVTNIIAIASGDSYALALNTSGKVLSWGKVPTSTPTNLTDIAAIAAGSTFGMALTRTGTVVGWGTISGATYSTPQNVQRAVAIAAGGSHAMALLPDGTVVAWGDSSGGKTSVPSSATNVVAIAAGLNHSVALKADGSLVAWGATNRVLVEAPGGGSIVSLACSASNTIAAFGSGAPIIFNEMLDTSLRASQTLSLTALAGGQPPLSYQWFWNGVPVPGATSANYVVPGAEQNASGAYYFTASNEFGMVTSRTAQVTVVPTRTVAAWGSAGLGDLINVPGGLTNIIKVAAGTTHAVALKDDGTVLTWGSNTLGEGDIPLSATNLVDIAAGSHFSIGIRGDGSVIVWGITNVPATPGTVPYLKYDNRPCNAVVALYDHALVLRRDGSVNVAGTSGSSPFYLYQSSVGSVAAIATGSQHCVALCSNGTVVCWGLPFTSPAVMTVPAGLSNVISIAAGDYHTLALRADGSIVAWGQNSTNVLNVPASLTNAIWISAGSQRSFACTAEGELVSWGGIQFDPEDLVERSFPRELRNVEMVAVGQAYSLAVTTDPKPCIAQHPAGRSIPSGWPLTFNSQASGRPPLVYQWQFNEANIENATNSLLSISNVTDAHFGNYRVLVTNLLGCVTSRVAILAKGNVLAWSTNDPYGRCWIPARASNLVAVSAGQIHMTGLLKDGSVVCWGNVTREHADVVRDLTGARAIAAGGNSGLAILSNATLKAWSLQPVSPPTRGGAVSADLSYLAPGGGVCYEDGTIARWGALDTNPPPYFTNIARIQAEAYGGLVGITYGGTLASWGTSFRQTNLANVVDLANVSGYGSADGNALLADGTIVSLNTGATRGSNFVSAAGLHADGTVQQFTANSQPPGPLSNVVQFLSMPEFSIVRFGDGSPSLTVQPYSRTVPAGAPFTLTAFATGNQPLSYQWQLNGEVIEGATNTSFTIQSPALNDIGSYRCIINNGIGSVTSEVAQVSLAFLPPLLGVWQSDPSTNGITLSVEKLSGQGPAIVYGSTNLLDWVPLLTNPPSAGSFYWHDTSWTNFGQRFYKVSEERP